MSWEPIGYRDQLVAQRAAILANVSPAARWRILGVRRWRQPAKAHVITIDLRKPEERTIEAIVIQPPTVPTRNPFRPRPAKNEMPRACWRILDAVAVAWQVTVDDLRGPRRHWKFAHPRFAAMLLIRESVEWSTPTIGKMFGGRDHSTVVAAIKRAKVLFDADRDYRDRYHAALASLDGEPAGGIR